VPRRRERFERVQHAAILEDPETSEIRACAVRRAQDAECSGMNLGSSDRVDAAIRTDELTHFGVRQSAAELSLRRVFGV
jgi:hypothetical protein